MRVHLTVAMGVIFLSLKIKSRETKGWSLPLHAQCYHGSYFMKQITFTANRLCSYVINSLYFWVCFYFRRISLKNSLCPYDLLKVGKKEPWTGLDFTYGNKSMEHLCSYLSVYIAHFLATTSLALSTLSYVLATGSRAHSSFYHVSYPSSLSCTFYIVVCPCHRFSCTLLITCPSIAVFLALSIWCYVSFSLSLLHSLYNISPLFHIH